MREILTVKRRREGGRENNKRQRQKEKKVHQVAVRLVPCPLFWKTTYMGFLLLFFLSSFDFLLLRKQSRKGKRDQMFNHLSLSFTLKHTEINQMRTCSGNKYTKYHPQIFPLQFLNDFLSKKCPQTYEKPTRTKTTTRPIHEVINICYPPTLNGPRWSSPHWFALGHLRAPAAAALSSLPPLPETSWAKSPASPATKSHWGPTRP
jgi:hypothetical protein